MNGLPFEEEVRRIAWARWPKAVVSGAAMMSGRERDGYFETEEVIHVVEATVSRARDKAEKDGKKLSDAVKSLRISKPQKTAKGWFITEHEPTAEQRDVLRKFANEVTACSYQTFCSALVDSIEYLPLREKYRFGSARPPEAHGELPKYVAVDLIDAKGTTKNSFIKVTSDFFSDPRRLLILGDYGAGKSMTLREIFLRLDDAFRRQKVSRFPIHLNLREHQGQTSAEEVLERHARSIGFHTPSQLIKAWRAGFVDLLLDGFDEIASSAWTGFNRKLKDIRYRNMAVVRAFVRDAPSASSIVIAGRQHYFDSAAELRSALEIDTSFREVSIGEFTEEQVAEFLADRNLSGSIPDWLPARPLLLGYVVTSDAFKGNNKFSAMRDEEGWDFLLQKICEREAQIETGLDGNRIRALIERLGTIARYRDDGLGHFTVDDFQRAFTEVCGYPPQEGADVVLLRLPGIGYSSQDDGTRSFIDEDIADAASAGDVVRFIQNPFVDFDALTGVQRGLQDLGGRVAALQLLRYQVKPGSLRTALETSRSTMEGSALAADTFHVAQELQVGLPGGVLQLNNAYTEYLRFHGDSANYGNLQFNNCLIGLLCLEGEVEAAKLPVFRGCYVGVLEGRTSTEDLPTGIFVDCEIESFDIYTPTTSSIMQLDVSPGIRVLLSILKKLFLQAGRARQESALFRGLDHRVRHLVPEVLNILAGEGIACENRQGGKSIWVPVRKHSSRVRSILASPNVSTDPVVKRSKALT